MHTNRKKWEGTRFTTPGGELTTLGDEWRVQYLQP